MKLKYYLRGIGIGVAITTILLTISLNGRKEKLTDSEIITRAKALGLVEESIFKENPDPEVDDKANQEAEKPAETEDMSDESSAGGEADTETGGETDAETGGEQEKADLENEPVNQDEADTAAPPLDIGGEKTITISSGMYSDKLSKELEAQGLIDNAQQYNQYLVQNGYDGRLKTGTYKIKIGATYEEIANIVTGH